MRRLRLAVLILVVLATAPAAGSSTPIVAETTKPQAIAAVRALLKASQGACGYRLVRMSARRLGSHWRVTAVVTGEVRGTSQWLVVGRKAKPASSLARTIRAGCPPAVQPAPPPPPPPPPEPPLSGPGAPATYVFGPELSAQEQVRVTRGLDAGARYYRAVLGRELPPLTVWAYRDLDALVRAYSQNEPSYSPERARQLWEAGQVGHATLRKVWFGPNWFVAGRPEWQALTIAAHEAFHLFQYELAGQRALGVSSPDEIPTAGPWWLAEGAAQYFAFLAIVREGLIPLAEVRRAWVLSTKQSTATLRDLATLRGQMGWGSYDIYALATELLLRDRDPKIVFSYYEAIGRNVPWRDAFTATFGRTPDAFVDEFEAYRRTL
jgi:hypothetical protein